MEYKTIQYCTLNNLEMDKSNNFHYKAHTSLLSKFFLISNSSSKQFTLLKNQTNLMSHTALQETTARQYVTNSLYLLSHISPHVRQLLIF
jgi:beta-N-acetylglucosaminidase